MPDLDPVQMLDDVIERGLVALRLAIPNAAAGNPAIAGDARKAFAVISSTWEAVDDALDNAAGKVAMIMADARVTSVAKDTEARG